MRTPLALLLLAACTRPAPVAPPAAPAPAPPPPVAAAAAVTCADAGVLLRGTVDDQAQAGPAKEAMIARTCRQERWPAELLRCAGEQPQAKPCLDKLTTAQRAAYDAALLAWNELYPAETLDEEYDGGEDYSDLAMYIDCSDAIQDASGFAPAVKLTGADRDYVLELRLDALLVLCEDWDHEQRGCFRDITAAGAAGNSTAVDACRAQLDPAQAKAVTDKLAELDALGARIAALKKTAASHDCKKVAAAHYADAAWKGKLDTLKPADRTKAIAESRARMTKACTDEKWTPDLRACIVAGGAGTCFTSVSLATWGFPAAGVFVKSGIPECDGTLATMKAVDACAAMPPSRRDAVKRSWGHLAAGWTSAPAERRAQTGAACKAFDEAIRRSLTEAGCKI